MNWTYCICFILIYLFLPGFILLSEACWGTTASNYGDTTRDYDLLVGSVLELNCTLKAEYFPGISKKVDSSNLVFTKDNQVFSNYIHLIDSRTAQLVIPNAQVNDSGIYHCALSVPDTTSKPHVCSTQVSVGYPPKNVSNFKCISRNFDNLTCTWDIEANRVKTNYSLQKSLFAVGVLQNCPTFNNTFCQWRDDTDPPYQTSNRNLTFIVHGNNSLGISENEFMLDHFEIVIPNNPENVSAIAVGKNFISIQWLPPKMKRVVEKPPLFYQLWLEELGSNPGDRIVYNVGIEEQTYRFDGLIPYMLYNISLRCRSLYAIDEKMWSPIISLLVKTEADIPSVLPEVNSQAFELYNFEADRNATLYWKPVSERYFNGENFHYHITYYPSTSPENKNVLFVKSFFPFVTIGHLNNDSAYIFQIYSANKEGISVHYKTLYIAKRNKIVPTPKEIRAISHELGYYNLSWAVTGRLTEYSYTVFWCSSIKPSKSRCDGPIQWSTNTLKENSFILNITDVHINFQFAVAAAVGNKSSGMEWASCIVPQKAPLGKIPIRHVEQKSSSALKIIWSLDCEAQKSVIDRYEITYCRLGKNSVCKVATAESNDESYILNDLHPFSNYSIKLRAFNKENIPSEDMEESYQFTLPGAPADPPQNVQVLSKSGTSFYISWLPPLEPNGIITHYYVNYNEEKQLLKAESLKKPFSCKIEGLSHFTKYNVSIVACVDAFCSPQSKELLLETDVGEPDSMDAPGIEIINSTYLKISWRIPTNPNGPIDFYLLKWQQKDDNTTSYKEVHGLSTYVEIDCSKALTGGINYLFYVRAANKKDEISLFGPFSNPTQATACIMSQGRAMIIGLAIGGALSLAVFMLAFYRFFKWMHDKIHQMKNIAVRLPKELEGPELNPLSNYENFKHGLVQKNLNSKTDRLSYVFEENENKNRHGSGSSQFSNASDELIFKNGKCTKFGRKPSGDSSGCSSMSSNTTTRIHLSSDSGTESDFPVPASPDSVLVDHNVHNSQKPPLPILVEQEALDLTSELQVKPKHSFKLNKYSISNGDYKSEHPYSKFGISSVQSSVPWRVNSLAFYSCNLANSEPSMFESRNSDLQNQSITCPYSKIGLAKSSGDILGITATSKNIGYSKFGVGYHQDCFSIDVANHNPTTVGMAVANDDTKIKWPEKNRFNNNKNSLKENSVLLDDTSFVTNRQMLDKSVLPDYLNNSTMHSTPHKLTSGYVSIGDVRSTKVQSPLLMSNNSSEMEELCETSSFQFPYENQDFQLYDISKDFCVNDINSIRCSESPEHHLIDLHNSPQYLDKSETVHPVLEKHLKHNYSTSLSDSTSDIHIHNERTKNTPQTELKDVLPLEENCFNQVTNGNQTSDSSGDSGANYSIAPSEILLTPVVSKNGYIPFSKFSCTSNRTDYSVPNTPESNASLSVFPSDICSDFDQNYITPSNKSDLKLLQENLISKNNQTSFVMPLKSKDTLNGVKRFSSNGNNISKISGSLKYLLKPLPKMESEICEV